MKRLPARIIFTVTAIALICANARAQEEAVPDVPTSPATEATQADSGDSEKEWTKPIIAPRPLRTVNGAEPAKSFPINGEDEKPTVSPDDYRRVYNSIPFNRAEYNANPSYRHEATMSILFGKRPSTVYRFTPSAPATINPVAYPAFPSPYGYMPYYPYWQWPGHYRYRDRFYR